MTARFNPPVISVNGLDLRDEIPADIPLQVLVEKQFDIFTQKAYAFCSDGAEF